MQQANGADGIRQDCSGKKKRNQLQIAFDVWRTLGSVWERLGTFEIVPKGRRRYKKVSL